MPTNSPNADPVINILIAYPYWKNDTTEVLSQHRERFRVIVDSGAFTAWKAGNTIALDDYCRFIESLPVTPWRYFTLDVIGDAHATLHNYETMLKRGFTPVPIFTRGEDASVLDDYYKTSDMVGIGGLVGTQDNKGFVNGIMRRVGKRKCHWLGFTNLDFIKAYRPYTCDSSSWTAGQRFASVHLYLGNGRSKTVNKKTFTTRPPDDVLEAVRRLGHDPHVFRNTAAWHGGYSTSGHLEAASAISYSWDIEKHLGTILFSAIPSSQREKLTMLLDGYNRLLRRRIAA